MIRNHNLGYSKTSIIFASSCSSEGIIIDFEFFLEYPKENIKKLSLISFPAKVYIQETSLKNFRIQEKIAEKINSNLGYAYWPSLEKSYWISPFSFREELYNLYEDLSRNNAPLEVLLDLEFPKFYPTLFVKNFPNLPINAKVITRILKESEDYDLVITTANYPILSSNAILNKLSLFLMKALGVYYKPETFNHKMTFMCFSSIIKNSLDFTYRFHISQNEHKEKMYVSLGLLSWGKMSNEGIIGKLKSFGLLKEHPLLSPKELDRDIRLARYYGIDNIAIYSVDGLNPDYLKVIQRHLDE